jgi:hypothetical protein
MQKTLIFIRDEGLLLLLSVGEFKTALYKLLYYESPMGVFTQHGLEYQGLTKT